MLKDISSLKYIFCISLFLQSFYTINAQVETTSVHKDSLFNNDSKIEKWLLQNNVPTLGIGIIKEGNLQQVNVFWRP